jgi:hypothetical protein
LCTGFAAPVKNCVIFWRSNNNDEIGLKVEFLVKQVYSHESIHHNYFKTTLSASPLATTSITVIETIEPIKNKQAICQINT